MKDRIPAATVARLPLYLRCLGELSAGQQTVSSDQLATMVGVNSAQVRKDLSHLGSWGTRGVGYSIDELRHQMARALGLTRDWGVAIVGIGNLGSALAHYQGFAERGFAIVGLFDADPRKVGTTVDRIEVEPLDRLEQAVAERSVSIGVVAVPAPFAQEVADRLVAAGVRSILNFAPVVLQLPPDVEVRRVDLSTELQIRSFYLEHGSSTPARVD